VNLLPSDAGRIDFISEYCDRWCERCPYTARCAAYACEVAIGMCGDVVEGLELALGRSHPIASAAPASPGTVEEPEIEAWRPTAETLAALNQELATREVRVDATALGALSFDYILRTFEWLNANHERLERAADPVLREALAVVSHDPAFIGAKLHRAETGRDDGRNSKWDDDPIQNDWNGSAKIALIALERSEAAWRTLASNGDEAAETLAARAGELRRLTIEEFPHAMAFVRPGFDEPGR
jgi:hypothetical protein